MKHIMVRSNLW